MGLVRGRRGQITLEFLLIFGILMIMLLYSARSITFNEATSRQTLLMQAVIEEKSVANTIAGAIDQVYAQGPGAKVTVYTRFSILRNKDYVEKAFNLSSPVVEFMLIGENDSLFPSGAVNSVLAVGVSNSGSQPILEGEARTGDWVLTLFRYNGTSPSRFEVKLQPSQIPPVMTVVVEWNPNKPVSMTYNSTTSTLHINLRVSNP
jgi:uncharacterized protein (UPF0333 family)